MTALLIRDEPWTFRGFHGTISTRRLRVWRSSPDEIAVVISEDGHGTSAINAAEEAFEKLSGEYPEDAVMMIIHVLASIEGDPHFTLVTFDETGAPSFHRLPPTKPIGWFTLPPLDD